jgi:hypothetical protein
MEIIGCLDIKCNHMIEKFVSLQHSAATNCATVQYIVNPRKDYFIRIVIIHLEKA